jgi:DNA-binding response OmpR family regulator
MSPHPANAIERSLRVLIVDEERESTNALCVAVSSWGHEVRRSNDGESGLTAALVYFPNVVLLDVAMADREGNRLTRQLRQSASLKGCYLIAMRGRSEGRGTEGNEMDVDLWLAKPMNLNVLQSLLMIEADRLDRLGLN